MIKEHLENTKWWGAAVGIITDSAFFDLAPKSREEALAPYEWVEFKSPLLSAPASDQLCAARFFRIDTQIGFRIALNQLPRAPSLDSLSARFADEAPFGIEASEPKDFEHERFLQLPGVTKEKLAERYSQWAGNLIEENSRWCVRILQGSDIQGWFLSQERKPGINLTLAMLRQGAVISGSLLYQRALLAYADRGAKIGWASFSVANMNVLNIYSRLGAHFTSASACWVWCRQWLK